MPTSENGTLLDVVNNVNGVVQNWGAVMVILCGAGGVALVLFASMRLYGSINDQHSTMHQSDTMGQLGNVLAIVIGGLMTIASVIVAWFGTWFG